MRIKFIIFTLFCTVLVSLGFLGGLDVLAQDGAIQQYELLTPLPLGEGGATTSEVSLATNSEGFGEFINDMLVVLVAVAGGLAVIVLIAGGIKIISSDSGDGKSKGKDYIKGALYGLLLALGGFVILNTINPDILNIRAIAPLNITIFSTPTEDGWYLRQVSPTAEQIRFATYDECVGFMEDPQNEGRVFENNCDPIGIDASWCFDYTNKMGGRIDNVCETALALCENRRAALVEDGLHESHISECEERDQEAHYSFFYESFDAYDERRDFRSLSTCEWHEQREKDVVLGCRYYEQPTHRLFPVVYEFVGLTKGAYFPTIEACNEAADEYIRKEKNVIDEQTCVFDPQNAATQYAEFCYHHSSVDGGPIVQRCRYEWSSLEACWEQAKNESGRKYDENKVEVNVQQTNPCFRNPNVDPDDVSVSERQKIFANSYLRRYILDLDGSLQFLGENEVRTLLKENDIYTNRGGESDATNGTVCLTVDHTQCTNVGGLAEQTINRLVELRNACREWNSSCSLTITGGTEWWMHGSRARYGLGGENGPISGNGTNHVPIQEDGGGRTVDVNMGTISDGPPYNLVAPNTFTNYVKSSGRFSSEPTEGTCSTWRNWYRKVDAACTEECTLDRTVLIREEVPVTNPLGSTCSAVVPHWHIEVN